MSKSKFVVRYIDGAGEHRDMTVFAASRESARDSVYDAGGADVVEVKPSGAKGRGKRAGGKRKLTYASRARSSSTKKRLVGGRRVRHSNRPMPYHLKVRFDIISTPDGYVLQWVDKRGRLDRIARLFPTFEAARAAAERRYEAGLHPA